MTTCQNGDSPIDLIDAREALMKTMTVGELKAQFSAVLDQIAAGGEPIAISYGRKKEKVAAIVPYSLLRPDADRQLGLLKGKGRCVIHDDFAISDDELLNA